MPIYTYYDKETGFSKEVMHSMSECDTPSESTLAEITHEGRVMTREITAPNIAVFGSLSALSKKDRLKPKSADIQQKMVQRSREHAKKTGIQEMKHEVNKSMQQQGREIFGR